MTRLAFYADERDNDPTCLDLSWQDVVTLLTEVTVTDCAPCPGGQKCRAKFTQAWSPADIEGERSNANVTAVTLGVFDLDHLSDEKLANVAAIIEPYTYVIHSTHSHRPGDNCLRLVIPLSRPVPAKQWKKFLATFVGLTKLPVDAQTKDLSRLYFRPTIPKGVEPLVETNEGKPIDVDDILNHVIPSSPSVVDATPLPYDLAQVRTMIRAAGRKKLNSTPKDPELIKKNKILGQMLYDIANGKQFCVAGHSQEETKLPKGRDACLNEVISLLVWELPAKLPFELFAEAIRPSLLYVVEPEGMEHWLKEARDMWERAKQRQADYLADREAEKKRVQESFEKTISPTEITEAEEPEVGEWMKYLLPGPVDKNGKMEAYRSCSHNVALILEHAEGVAGSFRWNDITRDIDVCGGLFDKVPKATLSTVVCNWLQLKWAIFLQEPVVRLQILAVARKNPIDPLRDYLEGLKWDGVNRIDKWLTDYCAVRTVNDNGQDISEWISTIGARWLISCVARALEPGCQVDTVLIFEGEEALRKSSAFNALGGAWYTAGAIVLGDKDSKMLAAQTWIFELAELASVRKSDNDVQKAFFTQRTDKFRPPYGAVVEEFPRRCVFVGTINPDGDHGYLTSTTGNRRFWPVRCMSDIDAEGLKRARDQLFAEAVMRFLAGECWWFEREESLKFEADVTNDRMVRETVLSDTIRQWHSLLQNKTQSFTLGTIAKGIGMDPAKMDRADEIRLGRALKELGFDRHRQRNGGTREYVYTAPKVEKNEKV